MKKTPSYEGCGLAHPEEEKASGTLYSCLPVHRKATTGKMEDSQAESVVTEQGVTVLNYKTVGVNKILGSYLDFTNVHKLPIEKAGHFHLGSTSNQISHE